MIRTIKTTELKPGMYVLKPHGWLNFIAKRFFEDGFLLESSIPIQKLLDQGIQEVQIDTSRSEIAKTIERITHPARKEAVPPIKWNPEKSISDQLRETLNNTTISPEERASRIRTESMVIMQNLFDSPTVECLKETKTLIHEIVDVVLNDDDTATNLLKITNHDFYTYTHSVNVGILGIALVKKLYGSSIANHDMGELGAGFFLHDLGKVRIDSRILNKPGPLNEKEMRRMRSHPGQSYVILKSAHQLSKECGVIAMQHHEREDGTGYPRGLAGDKIHEYARICCIADVFDALTAERSYKKAMSPYNALKIMKEEMLGHFHKEIFDNFVLLFA